MRVLSYTVVFHQIMYYIHECTTLVYPHSFSLLLIEIFERRSCKIFLLAIIFQSNVSKIFFASLYIFILFLIIMGRTPKYRHNGGHKHCDKCFWHIPTDHINCHKAPCQSSLEYFNGPQVVEVYKKQWERNPVTTML